MRQWILLISFLLVEPIFSQNAEVFDDYLSALNTKLYDDKIAAKEEFRSRLREDDSEAYLRALVDSRVMNFQLAGMLTETLPENLEFLGYGLCLQKNKLWESLMISDNRNAFSFYVLINENFAEESLTKVPISMAIRNRYKREELSQIFFDAQQALEKKEKSYEELKQEAISRIETLVNDPEFLADPRFWQPASSEESAVETVGGPPVKQTNHVVSNIGGDEAEYQPEEKPRSLAWLYWMLGALILGGVGVLVWNSRKGSSVR